jgi:hypothetical protein
MGIFETIDSLLSEDTNACFPPNVPALRGGHRGVDRAGYATAR